MNLFYFGNDHPTVTVRCRLRNRTHAAPPRRGRPGDHVIHGIRTGVTHGSPVSHVDIGVLPTATALTAVAHSPIIDERCMLRSDMNTPPSAATVLEASCYWYHGVMIIQAASREARSDSDTLARSL